MALDALLFDLDGTLIDTNLIHARAFEKSFEDNGYKVAVDRIAIEIGKGGDLLVGAILGKSADEKDGDAIRESYERHYLELVKAEPIQVFDGALEIIEKAKARELKIALATSGESSVMDAVEQSCGVKWRELFSMIVTSDDAKTSKPAPDIVSAATQKLGRAAARVRVYWRHDLRCARLSSGGRGLLLRGRRPARTRRFARSRSARGLSNARRFVRRFRQRDGYRFAG